MYRGKVIKSTGSQYWVKDDQGVVRICRLKGNIRLREYKTTNPVVVGDEVIFTAEGEDEHIISDVEKRKNYLIRRSINLSKQSHIIASNIDLAVLMVTISHPKTHLEFIDRYLVSAEAYHIPAALIFNKIDLLNDKEKIKLAKARKLYEGIGYKCVAISAENDNDFSEIKDLLKNKTSLISGHSGVGKTTLLNKLDKSLDLKTSEISAYHKAGKHTTTYAEIHDLKEIGEIIDTPGIKGLGVIDVPKEELSHYFPEMLKEIKYCKFHNCVHIDEPDCAVKKQILDGKISESRYRSYLSIYSEEADSFRKDLYR